MQGLNHTSCGFLGFAEKNPRGPYIVGQGNGKGKSRGNFRYTLFFLEATKHFSSLAIGSLFLENSRHFRSLF